MSRVFRGRTLTEARLQAEQSLGPDIVLVKKRKVRKRGLEGLLGATECEVEAQTALHGSPDAELDKRWPPIRIGSRSRPPQPTRQLPFAQQVYDYDEDDDDERGTPSTTGNAQHLMALHNEIRTIRAMIYRLKNTPNSVEGELNSLRQAVDNIKPMESTPLRVGRLLDLCGIDGTAARQLGKALRNHTGDDASLADALRDALADVIKVRPWPLASDERKLVAVVGPPGVGKTTTAAKIAARTIAGGDKSVCFISCDTYRVGAVEQLRRYAALLRADLKVVRNPRELTRAVKETQADLIIVDTAGRGPTNGRSVEAVLGKTEADGSNPRGWPRLKREVLLCLPAALRSADTEMTVEKYALTSPTAIAITKLDLTTQPGGLIHGTYATDLPVSTLCMGQRVPEDIAPATAGGILDYLVPRGTGRN